MTEGDATRQTFQERLAATFLETFVFPISAFLTKVNCFPILNLSGPPASSRHLAISFAACLVFLIGTAISRMHVKWSRSRRAEEESGIESVNGWMEFVDKEVKKKDYTERKFIINCSYNNWSLIN